MNNSFDTSELLVQWEQNMGTKLLKRCLRKNREAITSDLNPKYIIASLLKNNVVTEEEANRVMSKITQEKQTASLLGILVQKSSSHFEYFLQALEENDNYPWLAESMRNFLNNNSKGEKPDLYEKLLEGGVPFSINNLLPRDKELSDIRKAICDVCSFRRGWIVICGMVGSGKSVLAAEAVGDNDLFDKYFSGGIFWLPVGKLDDSELRMKMHLLCTYIDPSEHNQPVTTDLTNRLLKKLVAKCIRDKRQILLVLDDVWDKHAIKAFDIGCPAIVTTRSKDILDGISGRKEYIKLDTGLQLEETKELLSLHLDIAVNDLPHDEIKLIHERCKGSPIVVAMIGSMMQTYGNKEERWRKYRKQLEEGRAGRFRHSSDENRTLFQAIDISVKNLSEKMQEYYELFAVFKEDNNIPNQVLEIQWEMEKDEVEDIMRDFERKSLARITESVDDTYMYSIHDLHLDYLKEKCKDIKVLHKSFVEQYIKRCCLNNNLETANYDYGLLPDDKYIYYFLAYHLFMAEEYDLLNEIFLDMSFIEKKLKITGPSDLLNDYKIYEEWFKKEQKKDKSDFEKFVRNNASLVNKEDIDIIQLALCETPDSVVHSKAQSIALKREKPYFLWCNTSSIRKCILLNTKPHDGPVNCAVFAPDGKIAASVGKDKIVRIWDCTCGTLLHEFHGHAEEITCCVFSRNGNSLITASLDKTVKEWLIPSNTLTSKNERRRSSTFLTSVVLGDESNKTYTGHQSSVFCCCLSFNNLLIASGAEDGIGIVWQRESAVILYRLIGHSDSINCCCFSFDDEYIATASSDYKMNLWSAKDGHWLKAMLHGTDIVSSCQFDKKGKYVLSSAGGFVWKWKIGDSVMPEDKYNSIKSSYLITFCVLSPDEKHIAGGTSGNAVFVWSLEKRIVVACFKAHGDSIKCVSYSNDGNRILSTAEDGTLIVWDITKFLGFSHVSLSKHISVVFFDKELTIATPDEANCIQILTGLTGEVKSTFITENRDGDVSICCLSPDCTKVAYGTNIGVVKLFQIKTGQVREFSGHNSEVNFITFSPDGSSFATCSADCTLKIWKETGEMTTCSGHSDAIIRCKLFSNGEKILSCSKDGSMRVWNTTSGKLLMSCCGHENNTVTYCTVAPNEKYFASAGVDNKVILWDAEHGKEINCLTSDNCMRCCCFSPNSQYLAAGDDGGQVLVWDIGKDISTAITVSGHSHWVKKIIFSPNSSCLVSVASSIKWWSIEGKLLQTFDDGGDKYHIFANPDFSTFVTVDIAGTLYILKQLKS